MNSKLLKINIDMPKVEVTAETDLSPKFKKPRKARTSTLKPLVISEVVEQSTLMPLDKLAELIKQLKGELNRMREEMAIILKSTDGV